MGHPWKDDDTILKRAEPDPLTESWRPSHVIGLEELRTQLLQFTKGLVIRGTPAGNAILYGPNGSGKTFACEVLTTEFNEKATDEKRPMRAVHVSCDGRSALSVMFSIWEKFDPEAPNSGLDLEAVVKKFNHHLRRAKVGPLLIILDEADKCEDIDPLLLKVCRPKESGFDVEIQVLMVANDLQFRKGITPNVAKSLNVQREIAAAKYRSDQQIAILKQRVEAGCHKGTWDEDVISYLVAQVQSNEERNGDIRYGLAILRAAAHMANDERAKRITKDHVDRARTVVDDGVIREVIGKLDDYTLCHVLGLHTLVKLGYTRVTSAMVLTAANLARQILGFDQIATMDRNKQILRDLIDLGLCERQNKKHPLEPRGRTSVIEMRMADSTALALAGHANEEVRRALVTMPKQLKVDKKWQKLLKDGGTTDRMIESFNP